MSPIELLAPVGLTSVPDVVQPDWSGPYGSPKPNNRLPVAPSSASPFISGYVNEILDPSFEYDTLGSPPSTSLWLPGATSGAPTDFEVENGWASQGLQSLRVSYFGCPSLALFYAVTAYMPIISGATYSFGAMIYPQLAGTSCSYFTRVNWYNDPGSITYMSSDDGSATTVALTPFFSVGQAVAPLGAVFATFAVVGYNGSGGPVDLDFYTDTVQFFQGPTLPDYADGDFPDWNWTGVQGASQSVHVLSDYGLSGHTWSINFADGTLDEFTSVTGYLL